MTKPFLRVQNLNKSYGDHVILRDISFEMKQGDVLAIIGGSGSGKTTLLRCLSLLTTPDRGRIEIGSSCYSGGEPVDRIKWRQQIGIVFQQFHLWPHKTVFANLTLAPMKIGSTNKRLVEKEAMEWLLRVGLEQKFDRYPISLSGGEQQRVAFARTLMMKPRLVLLDEVTSSLDPELVGDVKQLMRALIKETGLTCILVTHDLAFVREVADRVLFLDQGKILERGTPKFILSHPNEERTKRFISSLHDVPQSDF